LRCCTPIAASFASRCSRCVTPCSAIV
jgi:hypothetical protein